MVTDDKSGKKLPPHAFGEWVFSRTIVFNAETRLINGADCRQVLANVAKDGYPIGRNWSLTSRRDRPVNAARTWLALLLSIVQSWPPSTLRPDRQRRSGPASLCSGPRGRSDRVCSWRDAADAVSAPPRSRPSLPQNGSDWRRRRRSTWRHRRRRGRGPSLCDRRGDGCGARPLSTSGRRERPRPRR
jgi:hypothetical protein